jgi:pimeloyl-ACP methyl ester carboxylesterase
MLQAPTYPFPVHDIKLFNDAHLAYMDTGRGDQTLLFIHGLANYSAGWKYNIESLSRSFRCVAIDLPGNGLSENVPGPYSISFFSKCIIDFIGRLGLTQVTLVGHSMGGQIALKMLADTPGCADKLVLCAPAGFEQFSDMDRLMYQSSMQYMSWFSNDEFNLQETLRNSFYKFPKAADAMIRDLTAFLRRQQSSDYRRMVDQCVTSMLNEPVFDKLKTIQQPTLIMYGEMDGLIPNKIIHPVSTREIGMQGVRQLPNAILEMIPQCGHFLQWEKAERVNELMLNWLQR